MCRVTKSSCTIGKDCRHRDDVSHYFHDATIALCATAMAKISKAHGNIQALGKVHVCGGQKFLDDIRPTGPTQPFSDRSCKSCHAPEEAHPEKRPYDPWFTATFVDGALRSARSKSRLRTADVGARKPTGVASGGPPPQERRPSTAHQPTADHGSASSSAVPPGPIKRTNTLASAAQGLKKKASQLFSQRQNAPQGPGNGADNRSCSGRKRASSEGPPTHGGRRESRSLSPAPAPGPPVPARTFGGTFAGSLGDGTQTVRNAFRTLRNARSLGSGLRNAYVEDQAPIIPRGRRKGDDAATQQPTPEVPPIPLRFRGERR